MEPEEHLFATDRAQLRRWLPWLHLFRGFGIALDIRKLLVCLCGLALFAGGNSLLDGFADESAVSGVEARFSMMPQLPASLADWKQSVSQAEAVLLEPLRTLFGPLLTLLGYAGAETSRGIAAARLVWGLLVWSFVGAAVIRMARHDVARGERGNLAGAVRFARRHTVSLLAAPLLPALTVAILLVLMAVVGLVGRIPGIGTMIVGAIWFVPLLVAAAQVLVVVGLIIGWPLMIATVSVEDADAFEGFSRAFSYVFSRPFYLLWLLGVSAIYGVMVMTVAGLMFTAMSEVARLSVSTGLGDQATAALMDPRSGLPGARMLGAWTAGLGLLLSALAISYIWSQVAMVYSLLRLSVDQVPLDDLIEEPATGVTSDLPLVGVAASEARERQLRQTESTDSSEEPPVVNA